MNDEAACYSRPAHSEDHALGRLADRHDGSPSVTLAQRAIVTVAEVVADISAAGISPRDEVFLIDCLRRRLRNAQDAAALRGEWAA